jgi:hypothetical protein
MSHDGSEWINSIWPNNYLMTGMMYHDKLIIGAIQNANKMSTKVLYTLTPKPLYMTTCESTLYCISRKLSIMFWELLWRKFRNKFRKKSDSRGTSFLFCLKIESSGGTLENTWWKKTLELKSFKFLIRGLVMVGGFCVWTKIGSRTKFDQ